MDETSNLTTETPTRGSNRAAFAFALCRVLVPSWLLAGAVYKLLELNPNLLPPPVIDVATWIGSLIGQDPQSWLGVSMRLMIGTEIMLAALMFFVPRFSRIVAAATLALFVVILSTVMVQSYDPDKGVLSALTGSCGCFGSNGPPPWAMLLIDGAMLAGVLLAGPLRRRNASPVALIVFLVCSFAGFFLAFGSGNAGPEPGPEEGPLPEPVLDANGWPPPPTVYEPYYYPQFENWVGKKLSSIPFAHLLPRPLPEGFDSGDWLVIYYRADCEHCQEMFLMYLSDPVLRTPTLAVGLPDYDPAGELEFLCTACETTELPGVPPEYVIQTPVIVRLKDGVVTAYADGSADEAEVEACINGTASP